MFVMAEEDKAGSPLVAGGDTAGSSLVARTMVDSHHRMAEAARLSRLDGGPEDFLVHIHFSKLLFHQVQPLWFQA